MKTYTFWIKLNNMFSKIPLAVEVSHLWGSLRLIWKINSNERFQGVEYRREESWSVLTTECSLPHSQTNNTPLQSLARRWNVKLSNRLVEFKTIDQTFSIFLRNLWGGHLGSRALRPQWCKDMQLHHVVMLRSSRSVLATSRARNFTVGVSDNKTCSTGKGGLYSHAKPTS